MKRIVFLMALGWLTVGTWAQQLSEQEAKDRALQYLNAKAPAKTRGLASSGLESAKVRAEKIYAFNREGGGFVIASADERTLPVLGYSDSGSIDWERMPENMQAWLKQYDEAIATLGDRTDFKDGNQIIDGSQSHVSTRTGRTPVEPLIKTRWSQGMAPYYNMTPLYAGHNPEWQGQRCPAGCVAVALAQVLNYWQRPKSLPDGLPAYESVDYMYDANLTWHIDALPPVTFDWENMLDEYVNPQNSDDIYGTEAQQQAVATLMRYCGQAVKSDYFPVGIGTSSDLVRCRDALVNHFGYAAATYLFPRWQFGIDEWEELVYTELAAGRPVIYGGTSPTMGGHALVCDGYDGNGLFHINWGLINGDGYYSLSVLNPYASTNPYKGSDGLGLTQGHCMIIGLDPSLEELKIPHSEPPELSQNQGIDVPSKNTVRFYFQYNHDDAGTATADHALGTIEADGTLTPRFIGDPNDSIISYYNFMIVEIDSTAFQPGETLRLHPMLRFRHAPEAEWQLIPPDSFYVDAGRREDGRFFIAYVPHQLKYVSASITAGLGRIGGSSDLTVTLRNLNILDYQGFVLLKPRYYGYINAEDVTEDTPYTEGDNHYVYAYVRAGQEGEVTFQINPKHGGLMSFVLSQDKSKDGGYYVDFDSFTMDFNNTMYSYDPYLQNNSNLTHEGNHYVYHVELCDRPGVTVPKGVPSDSIYLYARIASNDNAVINEIWLRDEIKDYLRALPDSAGSSNYKFTIELSLDIEQDGEYYVWSYLNEWLNAEHTEYILGANLREYFPVTTDPTVIKGVDGSLGKPDAPIYDLQGRRLPNRPARKGLYIRNGKKVIQ